MNALETILKKVEKYSGIYFSNENAPQIYIGEHFLVIWQINKDGELKYDSETFDKLMFIDFLSEEDLYQIQQCILDEEYQTAKSWFCSIN